MADLEKALRLHEEWKGKLTIESKVTLDSKEALSMAYTPGVAEPCKVIAVKKSCYLSLLSSLSSRRS